VESRLEGRERLDQGGRRDTDIHLRNAKFLGKRFVDDV
jgi:hypothetical protein